HPYTHQVNYPMLENGNQVMINICWFELDSCWNARSRIVLNGGKDKKGNPISITLIRYLSSKGWKKDADAMSKLTDAEIHAIENGKTNALDSTRSPFGRRIYQVMWEIYHYLHGANPSGNSVTMRIELFKTSLTCSREHLLFGVGTGGQEKAFANCYQINGTMLDEDWRWMHSHNQFLSSLVTLGIPGLIFFLLMLFYPASSMKRWGSFLFLAFFIVLFLSFIDEDTLETSQGVIFFAFFNSLFLFAMPWGSAVRQKEMKELPEEKQGA
ncbi:MAG TPA: O-antigen ligase family protein, partial [Bacteroidia bacterium]|nr:O-antigen ligase family protein [Bacteroidia bacterium]